jgi:hypothetical protein
VRGSLGRSIAACLLAGLVFSAKAEGIYTCVDSKGRRLTADRPIADCIDREQAEISPTGKVVRKIGPSLTADERLAEEEKAHKLAEDRSRQLDEKRRDRALLARYPERPVHDKERAQALSTADGVIASAAKRSAELAIERRKLDTELEFFKGDLSKAPPQLRRQIQENEEQVAAQKRFIAGQEGEKQRINARYDEELVRLKVLWAQRELPSTSAVPTSKR